MPLKANIGADPRYFDITTLTPVCCGDIGQSSDNPRWSFPAFKIAGKYRAEALCAEAVSCNFVKNGNWRWCRRSMKSSSASAEPERSRPLGRTGRPLSEGALSFCNTSQ